MILRRTATPESRSPADAWQPPTLDDEVEIKMDSVPNLDPLTGEARIKALVDHALDAALHRYMAHNFNLAMGTAASDPGQLKRCLTGVGVAISVHEQIKAILGQEQGEA